MRQISPSQWECTQCGAKIWIERGGQPRTALVTTSVRPRERVVTVDGEIVHRCTRDDG